MSQFLFRADGIFAGKGTPKEADRIAPLVCGPGKRIYEEPGSTHLMKRTWPDRQTCHRGNFESDGP
jgi:hypothetical protein